MSRIFVIILTLNSIFPALTQSERWITFRAFGFIPLKANDRVLSNSSAHAEQDRAIRKSDSAATFWLPAKGRATPKELAAEMKKATNGSTEKPETTPTEVDQAGQPLADPAWTPGDLATPTIFLSRNNCELEMQIKESENVKRRIEYEDLRAGTSGRCRTILRGTNGILLAVVVSNVRLNTGNASNVSSDEVLKVVTKNYGFEYTLREYRGSESYNPVILTEADETYLILRFNGTQSHAGRSRFDLEVFDYRKNENSMMLHDNSSGYGKSETRDVDKIYLTTDAPP